MLNGMPLSATGGAMGGAFFLPRANLQDLLDLLREDGRRLIGPTIADEAIVYVDAVHPTHQTRFAGRWLPRGQRCAIGFEFTLRWMSDASDSFPIMRY